MAEQQDVFVFGTANDVHQRAPEQIRQGRFGSVVFVDLPGPEDRADIFRVHLAIDAVRGESAAAGARLMEF